MPLVLKKSGTQALGRSHGVSCKSHLVLDSLGTPLRLRLTPGQWHNSTQAHDLGDGLAFECLIADGGYAAADFFDHLLQRGLEVIIPSYQRTKALHDYDQWLYRERQMLGCFINKIKHSRCIFSRFDKLDRSYLGFLHFVSALISLR